MLLVRKSRQFDRLLPPNRGADAVHEIGEGQQTALRKKKSTIFATKPRAVFLSNSPSVKGAGSL